eukprot:UN04706
MEYNNNGLYISELLEDNELFSDILRIYVNSRRKSLEGCSMNLWMGSENVITKGHYDEDVNLFFLNPWIKKVCVMEP